MLFATKYLGLMLLKLQWPRSVLPDEILNSTNATSPRRTTLWVGKNFFTRLQRTNFTTKSPHTTGSPRSRARSFLGTLGQVSCNWKDVRFRPVSPCWNSFLMHSGWTLSIRILSVSLLHVLLSMLLNCLTNSGSAIGTTI